MPRALRVVALLASLAMVAGACASAKNTGFPPPDATPPGKSPAGHDSPGHGGNGGGGGGTTVEVIDNEYDPKEITVKAGATVLFKQTGTEPHTVTADDNSFDSHPECPGDQSKCMFEGDEWSHRFEKAGSYPYYCKLHGGPGGAGMAGVVTVE